IALEGLAVEQQGKVVRAALDMKGDLSTALAEAAARVGVTTQRQKSQNNLKLLAIAMHNYHDTYGRVPPAVVPGKDGKPLSRWGVALLPFTEEAKLYQQFKLDEPWASPNNKPLLARMPWFFAAPGATKDEPFTTHYQVLVGGGAMFEPNRAVRLSEIT